MPKIFKIYICLVMLVAVLLLSACGSNDIVDPNITTEAVSSPIEPSLELMTEPIPMPDAVTFAPVEKTNGGVRILVDPRMELLSIIQIISPSYNSAHVSKLATEYKVELQEWFGQYAEHEAVVLFDEMSQQGFAYDAPPAVMLHMNNGFDLPDNAAVEEIHLERCGGIEGLQKFAAACKDFAQDTDFAAFYEAHRSYYETQVSGAAAYVREGDIAALEAYYGSTQHSYSIILVSGFLSGGYGSRVKTQGDGYDVYNIIGPTSVDKFIDEPTLRELIWHEFGHSYVNPLTEQFNNEVNTYHAAFDPIRSQMNTMAYTGWTACVNEHINRAVVARIWLSQEGQAAYENALRIERKQGFVYIDALAEKLALYEADRKTYPTFVDFYPVLLGAFDTETTSKR